MSYPDDLKYTKDHEWLKIDGDTARMGITQFAQAELGDIVFVDLPAAGKQVKQKETLCVVESTKAASDVYAPVGGTVKAVNTTLASNPEQINSDPYIAGWLIELEKIDSADLGSLMSADEYRKLIGE